MSDLDTAYIKVRPDLAGFEADATRVVRRSGEKAGKAFGVSFGGSFRKTVAGVAGGFLLAGGIQNSLRSTARLIGDLGKAAIEEERRTVLLSTALANLGIQTTIYGQKLAAVIETESRAKGFTEIELTDSFIRLASVTKDSVRAYDLLQLAEDVSRKQKIGLTKAATTLARVESGSLTAVRRLGLVQIPKLTKEEAKLSKERRNRILATKTMVAIEETFSGTTERVAGTAVVATERLGVALGDIESDIGRALLPTITSASTALADFLGEEENQTRIQRDVNEVIRIGVDVTKGLAGGIDTIRKVAAPLVSVLGGAEKTVRLLLTAMAVGKVAAFAGVLRLIGPSAAVATTGLVTAEVAAASMGTTAAVSASRVALLRAGLLRLGAIGVVAVGIDVLMNREQTTFNDPGQITEDELARLRKFAGEDFARTVRMARESALRSERRAADYTILEDLRNIPYSNTRPPSMLEEPRQGVGNDVLFQQRLALSLTTSSRSDEEALYRGQLEYVNRQVMRLERDNELTRTERKRLVRLYGTKAELQDSIGSIEDERRAAAEAAAKERKAAAEEAARRRKEAEQRRKEAAELLIRVQEQRLQIRLQEAQATTGTADDIRAHRALMNFYAGREKRLREEGDAEGSLAARASRLQERSEIVGIQREEDKRLAQEAKERSARLLSLKEQRLQLRVQQAELTKTTRDDIRAQKALIRYYGLQEVRLRESGALAASVEARSNKISAQLALRGIRKQGEGFSPTQFFQEAINNFRSFGSNIGGQGSVLSGQQARGAFAGLALAGLEKVRKKVVEVQGETRSLFVLPGAKGLIERGNLDLLHRKVARVGKDIATVRSLSIGTDRGETLIPSVIEGKIVSEKQAIAHFNRTGDNLGTFKSVAAADTYAERLHQQQASFYGKAEQTASSSLTEQQKQTQLLSLIAGALGANGKGKLVAVGRRGSTAATQATREQAAMQSLGGHGAI